MANPWVTETELETPSSPYAGDAIASASYLLWALSGRRYNFPRSVIETYQCPEYEPTLRNSYQRPRPELRQGSVYNICTSCGTPSSVRLRNTPALAVEYIEYQGVKLSSSSYELYNRSIVRPTNDKYWDLCSGIKIRYRFGQPPPVTGRRAAKVLADQFVRSWSGETCKLPQRLTSITRQGISMTVLDSQDFLDQGKTGLYEVDLFLRVVNPSKATRRSRVFSPDIPRAARVSAFEMLPEATDLVIIPGELFEYDFVGVPGPSIDETSWRARGQIELERNSTAIVLGDSYWTVIPDGVRLTIDAADSLYDSVTNGTFKLYAVRVDDENVAALIYTCRVFVTAQEI